MHFAALASARESEWENSMAWRPCFATDPREKTMSGASSSAQGQELALLREQNQQLMAKMAALEAEAEEAKSSKKTAPDSGGGGGAKELPGMHSAAAQAEQDYSRFSQFETAISDQMEVIEKLTDEKQKLTVELGAASKQLRQKDRENATLAYQLKQLLARIQMSKKR